MLSTQADLNYYDLPQVVIQLKSDIENFFCYHYLFLLLSDEVRHFYFELKQLYLLIRAIDAIVPHLNHHCCLLWILTLFTLNEFARIHTHLVDLLGMLFFFKSDHFS